MSRPKLLQIMYDQLRCDYLSSAIHSHLPTPAFNSVTAMAARFT